MVGNRIPDTNSLILPKMIYLNNIYRRKRRILKIFSSLEQIQNIFPCYFVFDILILIFLALIYICV